jgi:hypothetical protein
MRTPTSSEAFALGALCVALLSFTRSLVARHIPCEADPKAAPV